MRKSGKIHSCGFDDRYSSGACRPCARAKQNIRNRADRLPCHIENEEKNRVNNLIKEKAKQNNLAHYDSLTPCDNCGKKMRFVCNGGCIYCN